MRRSEQNLAGQFARIDKSAPRTVVYTIETLRDRWHYICCVTRDNGCRKIGQSFTIESESSSRAPYFKLKNRAPGMLQYLYLISVFAFSSVMPKLEISSLLTNMQYLRTHVFVCSSYVPSLLPAAKDKVWCIILAYELNLCLNWFSISIVIQPQLVSIIRKDNEARRATVSSQLCTH